MGERRLRRFGGLKTGLAGLLAVGVVGAIATPAALAAVTGTIGTSNSPKPPAVSSSGAPSSVAAATVTQRQVAAATSHWDAGTATSFWTPARLASATPATVPSASGKVGTASQAGTATEPTHHAAPMTAPTAPRGIPQAGHSSGLSTVGIIFYVSRDMTTHYCTASVVKSKYGNLLLTAAHCQPGRAAAFVPKYQHGARNQPYGIWAVTKVFRDYHWNTTNGTDYDYEFVQVGRNSQGRMIQSVTGANTLTRTPSYDNYVTVVGYPKISADSRDMAVRCGTYRTRKLSGYHQMAFYCGGFYGGTSGSPWLAHFNGSTGQVIGLIGGYQEGGPNDWTSYSPIFDSRTFALYEYAQTH